MNRIAIVRRKAGLTQEQLAAELNMDQSAISKIENETVTVSLANLRDISRVLRSTVSELVETPPFSEDAMFIARMFDALSPKERKHVQALVDSLRGAELAAEPSLPERSDAAQN